MDSVAICGLKTSLEWLKTVDPWAVEAELTEYLLDQLRSIPEITLYHAPPGCQQAGVISLNLEGFRANEVAAILDREHDIAVRAGHHCAGLIHEHLRNKKYDGCLRVSLGIFNTKDDIDALVRGLSSIDREVLKSISNDILRGNC